MIVFSAHMRSYNLRLRYEEGEFRPYYAVFDDPALTKEEYNANIDDAIIQMELMLDEDFLIKEIERCKKKKNGTLHLNRIGSSFMINNTIFFQEWHNSWSYYELRFKPLSDTTIGFSIVQSTSTPC